MVTPVGLIVVIRYTICIRLLRNIIVITLYSNLPSGIIVQCVDNIICRVSSLLLFSVNKHYITQVESGHWLAWWQRFQSTHIRFQVLYLMTKLKLKYHR